MTKARYTPAPWHLDENGDVIKHWYDEKRFRVASFAKPAWHEDDAKGWDEAYANAAHIVKCVNLHDELVGALESVLGFEVATPKDYATKGAEAFSPLQRHIIEIQNKARAVLAKATGDL